ncbi:MAG: hypothetical protein P4M09_15215 [Devosia sp.]|nr:hypothetical protein [Devosia sp.]
MTYEPSSAAPDIEPAGQLAAMIAGAGGLDASCAAEMAQAPVNLKMPGGRSRTVNHNRMPMFFVWT